MRKSGIHTAPAVPKQPRRPSPTGGPPACQWSSNDPPSCWHSPPLPRFTHTHTHTHTHTQPGQPSQSTNLITSPPLQTLQRLLGTDLAPPPTLLDQPHLSTQVPNDLRRPLTCCYFPLAPRLILTVCQGSLPSLEPLHFGLGAPAVFLEHSTLRQLLTLLSSQEAIHFAYYCESTLSPLDTQNCMCYE